jgi:SAM-dependent methyltransferase
MDPKAYARTFLRFFESLPRQGPGEDRYTLHIFKLLTGLPPEPKVADMGCGTGAQTLILAQAGCTVTGIDLHEPFLSILSANARRRGFQERVSTLLCSMDAVPSETGPFDLIWSEGAVYIIGFENGLKSWFQLLKPGGYLVVSEICWLVRDPPEELRKHPAPEIRGMQSVEKNMALVGKAGYRWIGSVLLPHEAWDEFDRHQEELIRAWRGKGLNAVEEQVFSDIEKENALFKRYRGTYGDVFFIMQKPDIS